MKRILVSVALFATIGAAQAQSQTGTLLYQVHLSPTKTVSLMAARTVSFKAGDRYIIDRNGVKHFGTFSDTAVTNTAYWAMWAPAGNQVFHNPTVAGAVDCVNSQSTIDWTPTERQVIADGCAFHGNVKALTRN